MRDLFLEVLKLSILCSAGILLISFVSVLLRRTHTVFWRYCLWVVLAVRLLLPFDFSIPGRAVIIPLPISMAAEEQKPAVSLPLDGQESDESDIRRNAANPGVGRLTAQTEEREAEEGNPEDSVIQDGKTANNVTDYFSSQNLQEIASQEPAGQTQTADIRNQIFEWAAAVWAAGAALLFIWQTVCYAVFSHKVKQTRMFFGKKENLPIYTSSAVFSPMLTGIRNPQIVLPNVNYSKDQLALILEHESMHYKSKDLLVKLLFNAAKTFHWFNPLVVWMERQALQDMELLCDSRVVRWFSREEKKFYGQTLLECASSKKGIRSVLCTSEFSRNRKLLKNRLANICSGEGKKKGILAVILGVLLVISVSLFVVPGSLGNHAEDTLQSPDASSSKAAYAEAGTERENELEEKRSILLALSEEDAAKAVYGDALPRLVYASDERAVLYDDWGLLIYDMKKRRIEQLLDLKAFDNVTHVEVSSDGGRILFCNESDGRERFIYEIENKRLAYSELDSFTEQYYDGLMERGEQNYAFTDTGKAVYLSADSLRTEDGDFYHSEDMQGLSLIVSGPDWGESEIYPLFSEYFETQGDQVFTHRNMRDFSRVVGKKYLYGDEYGWSYYLEEDEKHESSLWGIADILEPLLLTRYKDEERQVLEDLIYQESYLECPVLFAGGRILYKAALQADIIGVKDASLVSIAMDGSDRTIADTIMYCVFDGICEDGGWIYYSGWKNDALPPRPLCRISPDFSSGAQLVEEIPGYLCGVMDGYVYYLAGKDRKSGIWKRNLATGEEQIYDKWGMAAEDIQLFWAREQQFFAGELRDEETPGCRILYCPDYDGEFLPYALPFDTN